MTLALQIARLFRKKPVNNGNGLPGSCLKQDSIGIGVTKSTNPPMVIGYLTAFTFATFLAPSTLPAVLFISCTTSLLTELCKFEFMTCTRGTSACPYICIYQLLGELPAYLYGWLKIINNAIMTALLAQGLGSVLLRVACNSVIRLHLASNFLHEDVVGIGAQLVVSVFVACGLQITSNFTVATKILLFSATVLFVSSISSYSSISSIWPSITESAPKDESLLLAASIIFITFRLENSELNIRFDDRKVSVYVGVNHCIHLILLLVMTVTVSFIPIRSSIAQESSSPLLEILMKQSQGRHWFILAFACLCILIEAFALVESIQDSGRHIIKMASDGLLWTGLAKRAYMASMVALFLSAAVELTFPTFHLLCLAAFTNLALPSMIGFVVTYRRYCSSFTFPSRIAGLWRGTQKRSDGYIHPVQVLIHSEESDDTDVDAAVDEYKTKVYVSTVTSWSGDRYNPSRGEQSQRFSRKIQYFLIVLFILIVAISFMLRDIKMSNGKLQVACVVCLVIITAILFVLWLQPQRIRTNPIFKVPCVPWIPISSTLFLSVLLFQLPSAAWTFASGWVFLGLIVYGTYGYHQSRLKIPNIKIAAKNYFPVKPTWTRVKVSQLFDISANSTITYPQPYHNLT